MKTSAAAATTIHDHSSQLKYTLPLLITVSILLFLSATHLNIQNIHPLTLLTITNFIVFVLQLRYISTKLHNKKLVYLLRNVYLVTILVMAAALLLGDVLGTLHYNDPQGSHIENDLLSAGSLALVAWIPLYVMTTIYLFRKYTVYPALVKRVLLTIYGALIVLIAYGLFSFQMALHDPSVE